MDDLKIVPANEATAEDLRAIFGECGVAAGCQCQWFKLPRSEFRAASQGELTSLLREQTGCGNPAAQHTTGLVAFLGGEPAGWCAVEPRVAYPRLLSARVPWLGRDDDRTDPGVWAVTCFVTRSGYRKRGISRALAGAAVEFARARGAHAIEGYPVVTQSGRRYPAGDLYVGTPSVFVSAGFTEVSRPTPTRAVMRLELSSGT